MMVKPKAEPREAWQHVGLPFGDVPAWVWSSIMMINGELFLCRRSGRQRIEAGDWLIRNLDGEPEWLTHDQMRKQFEEVMG